MLNKRYRLNFKDTKNGFIFGITDYESIPYILVSSAMLVGTLIYAYVKLSQM